MNMNQVVYPSSNVNLKKRKSINSIEQLSNEIIYEIFGYLDGYDIYYSFSTLNARFEKLLNDPFFYFKFQFSYNSNSTLDDRFENFIRSKKHHIISFQFLDQIFLLKFLKLFITNSSFDRLESIILNEISAFKLVALLFHLRSLPYLHSLTAHIDESNDELDDIYQIIFKLPFLKYFKLIISGYRELQFNLSLPSDEQCSPLKYLVINHHLSLNELTELLSYTPQLTHLYCSHVIQTEDNGKSEVLTKLNNLIHLTITIYYLTFDNFEEYFIKLFSQLRILSVTIHSTDSSYLDADRWEQLIVHYMPYLKKLFLCYAEVLDDDFQINSYHELIKRFISSFWINNDWTFMIVIDNNTIYYLIRPEK